MLPPTQPTNTSNLIPLQQISVKTRQNRAFNSTSLHRGKIVEKFRTKRILKRNGTKYLPRSVHATHDGGCERNS